MKTLNIGIIILLSFFLILVGCAKKDSKSSDSDTSTTTTDTDTTTTSSYTRGNTPEKSSVDLPASLSGSGSSSSRSANQEISSVFYSMLKAGVMMMKTSVSSADLNLMLADVRVADSTKGTCYDVGEYSLTFTEAMYNSLVNMEKEFGGEEGADNSISATFKQFVGKEINPPVAYKLSDISEGGYSSELKVGDNCSAITSGSGAETFRWDTSKKKLQVAFDDSSGGTTMKGSFSYDDDKKKSSINMTYDDGTNAMKMTMNLATCNDNQSSGMSGDCAIYSFTQSYSDATYGESMMKGSGKADDKGGYGEAKMSMTYNGSDMSIEYKENWDGSGTVTYAAIKQGGSWTVVGGEADTTYSEDSYDSQPYSITVEVSGSSYTTKGSYHLVLDGKDPNSAPEAIVGYGEIRGAESFWDFWGGDTSATLDLWEIPSSGDMEEVPNAAITITAN